MYVYMYQALKLPADTFKSGKAWCVAAMGERGAAIKLHANKSDWKFGPPTKDFQTWWCL